MEEVHEWIKTERETREKLKKEKEEVRLPAGLLLSNTTNTRIQREAKEKKEAEGPIDALRPRVAALARCDVPPPRPQPVAPGRRLQGSPPAPAPAGAKAAVEVEWGGSWYAAEVLRVSGGLTLIHYTG